MRRPYVYVRPSSLILAVSKSSCVAKPIRLRAMLFMIKALSLDGPDSRARTLYSFARARHWSAFNMEDSADTTIHNLTVVAA
jgi:hypothetical protein